MAPGTDCHEIFRTAPGVTRPIISIAIRLRPPAIASGVQSMDLIRTPPSDQRNAVASNSTTCLFKAEFEKSGVAGVAGVQEANTYDGNKYCRRIEFQASRILHCLEADESSPQTGKTRRPLQQLLNSCSSRLFQLRASLTRGTPTLHYVHQTRMNYSAPGEHLFPAPHSERNLDHNPDPGCPS
jgi:hypothetical protein